VGGMKKYLTPTNIVIGLAGLGLVYFGYQYFIGDHQKKKKHHTKTSLPPALEYQLSQTVVNDPRLSFTVNPTTVKPGVASTITIAGTFKSKSGMPAAVHEGFYSVYDSMNNVVSTGSLGKNVSAFSRQIALPPLGNGEFMVAVSDKPIKLRPQAGSGGAIPPPLPPMQPNSLDMMRRMMPNPNPQAPFGGLPPQQYQPQQRPPGAGPLPPGAVPPPNQVMPLQTGMPTGIPAGMPQGMPHGGGI